MKVYLDAQADIDYVAFYIQGLYDYFGKKNVFFSNRYFRGMNPNRTFKFVIKDETQTLRYIIDWGDDYYIDKNDYHWCDYYGKINFNAEKIEKCYHTKAIKLPPSFGVKIWNFYESTYHAITNLMICFPQIQNLKKFLAKYYKQKELISITNYKIGNSNTNYIFSIHALWYSDEWINNDLTVNLYRARFMEACKTLNNIKFEGGFVYSQKKNLNPRFSNLLINESWIPKGEYIEKIRASLLVFNTPAWASCHGWKLGEYLALGKAIISTPFINELPAPLEHGKHIHFVSGSFEEIKEAIELILNDKEYRHCLEKGAYEYYLKYVEPTASIKLLLNGY